jgi:hypothetical protein
MCVRERARHGGDNVRGKEDLRKEEEERGGWKDGKREGRVDGKMEGGAPFRHQSGSF